jgi:hypothetical protein
MEKDKAVRKENFISSLRMYYKQCQVMRQQHLQPTVQVQSEVCTGKLARGRGTCGYANQGAEEGGPSMPLTQGSTQSWGHPALS